MKLILIPILTGLLLTISACKTPKATETRTQVTEAVATPKGEVILGEEGKEFIGQSAIDPRKGYFVSLMVSGPTVGSEIFESQLQEGQAVFYDPATGINEMVLNMEQENARLYLGLNFEGNKKGNYPFAEGGRMPTMKLSVTTRQGEVNGRVEAGLLSLDSYEEKAGFIIGKIQAQVNLSGQRHQVSGSFMLPLQNQ